MKLGAWMSCVGAYLWDDYGIATIETLPDMPWVDWYDAGVSPADAATEAYERVDYRYL